MIELADGRWGAIECKLSHSAVPAAERNLLRLRDLVAKNPSPQQPEPSFLMVLVSVAPMVYTTKAGVVVAPLMALGASRCVPHATADRAYTASPAVPHATPQARPCHELHRKTVRAGRLRLAARGP